MVSRAAFSWSAAFNDVRFLKDHVKHFLLYSTGGCDASELLNVMEFKQNLVGEVWSPRMFYLQFQYSRRNNLKFKGSAICDLTFKAFPLLEVMMQSMLQTQSYLQRNLKIHFLLFPSSNVFLSLLLSPPPPPTPNSRFSRGSTGRDPAASFSASPLI